MCALVEDPISICYKRIGLTATGMITQTYCMHLWVKPLKMECGCPSSGIIKKETAPQACLSKSGVVVVVVAFLS